MPVVGVREIVTQDGLNSLLEELDKRVERLEDNQRFLRSVGKLLAERRRLRFIDEAGPDGPWPPLAPSTVKGFREPRKKTKAGELKQRELRGAAGGRQVRFGKRSIREIARGELGRALLDVADRIRGAKGNRGAQNLAVKVLADRLGISESRARKAVGERRGSQTILRRSGRLMKSITDEAGIDVGENSVSVGTNVPYLVYHQSLAPRSKIPLRRVLGFDEGDKEGIAELLDAHTGRIMRGSAA